MGNCLGLERKPPLTAEEKIFKDLLNELKERRVKNN